MTQPLVYLAGPIAGLDYTGATCWRVYAEAALAKAGIKALSPMRAKGYLKDVKSFSATGEDGVGGPMSGPRAIMTRDRFDATRCDVMLVNLLGAARVSIGTVMEIAWADAHRIPTVVIMESGNIHEHGMLDEATGFRTADLDEALAIVRAVIG